MTVTVDFSDGPWAEAVKILSATARLIDSFNPIRQEFIR